MNDSKENKLENVTSGHVVCPKQWLVAIVHICHEKKTSERLSRIGIENFLPVQKELRQWSDRRKVVERILLPMMLFVHVNQKEKDEVLALASVSRYLVMRGEHTPTVIPDEQIERFRFMLDYSEETVCMNSECLVPGENIHVIKGPLAGLTGELVTVNGKSKVAVRLEILGCACVDMPVGFVESVQVPKISVTEFSTHTTTAVNKIPSISY